MVVVLLCVAVAVLEEVVCFFFFFFSSSFFKGFVVGLKGGEMGAFPCHSWLLLLYK